MKLGMLKIANMYIYDVNMSWGKTTDTGKSQQIVFDRCVGFAFREDEIEPVKDIVSIMLKIPKADIGFEYIDKEQID